MNFVFCECHNAVQIIRHREYKVHQNLRNQNRSLHLHQVAFYCQFLLVAEKTNEIFAKNVPKKSMCSMCKRRNKDVKLWELNGCKRVLLS